MKNRNELKVLLLFLLVGCWTHAMAVPRDEYPRPQFEKIGFVLMENGLVSLISAIFSKTPAPAK